MAEMMNIYCWTCNDFTLGEILDQQGNKVYIRCQECGQFDTDEINNPELEMWLKNERKKEMSSNDNALLRRECRNKNCSMRNKVIATSTPTCSVCTKPLDICRDQTKPIEAIAPSQPALPIVASGAPTYGPDRMVWARHDTRFNDQEKQWLCWCGQGYSVAKDSTHHDNTWTKLPWKDVPHGVLIKELSQMRSEPPQPKPTQTDDWNCSADVVGCPLISSSDRTKLPQIVMPSEMFKKWGYWARKFDTEWLAYLIGEEIPRDETHPMGGWRVTDMYVPKQKVTATHVTVAEEELRNLRPGVIGDVHSHVRMQAYFSEEDKRHMNHPVHIVINAREDIDLSVRITLECGKPSRITGRLLLAGSPEEDSWEAEMKSQLLPDPPPIAMSAVETSATTAQPSNTSTEVPQPTQTLSGWRGHQSTWKT